ncbi:hypothetical protein AAF712_016912, partial [Marasmius tenuissimus]
EISRNNVLVCEREDLRRENEDIRRTQTQLQAIVQEERRGRGEVLVRMSGLETRIKEAKAEVQKTSHERDELKVQLENQKNAVKQAGEQMKNAETQIKYALTYYQMEAE